MNKIFKRGFSILLAGSVLLSGTCLTFGEVPGTAAESNAWVAAASVEKDSLLKADYSKMDQIMEASFGFLQKSPAIIGSIGGEWRILGLARSDMPVKENYIEDWYKVLEEHVKDCKGILHARKYSDYSRTVLALTAAGYDPTNVAGYDLLAPLGDYEKTIWQGINGPIFALLALDCGNYAVPKAPEGALQATRQMYVDNLLSRQLSDGGFALSGTSADPDVTAMALQALAGYQDQAKVKTAVNKALECISELQDEEGGFSSFSTPNCESVSQVIVALCELGITLDDPRFVKNEQTLLDALFTFYLKDGEFTHIGTSANGMATEQAFYAMTAAARMRDGSNSLYTMDDAEKRKTEGSAENQGFGLPGKHKDIAEMPVTAEGKTFADIAGHPDQAPIEAMAERGIINGMNATSFAPDNTMTRAQFAAIVVRSLGLSPQAVDNFVDISDNSWYAGYVGTAYTYGIVKGTSDTTFNPEGTISRQEAAVMVARAAGLCGMDTKLSETAIRNMLAQFADYRTCSSWATESLAFCYSEDILSQADLEIQPKTPIKRCEIARMLYNMMNAGELLK
ncbi:MAG: S-layer homology domain-containing protein [Firmicutes bacterium]|nr:S-layer homology domain-containing protein [Bacillota bacterium]